MKWLKEIIDYLKSKEFKELVQEKIIDQIKRQSVKKVANDTVDEIFESSTDSIKKTNTELTNLTDTLKLTEDFLKNIKESTEALEATQKSSAEQSAKRQQKHLHSLIDVLSSAPNLLAMSFKYVKEFSGFFDDAEDRAKSLKELNRESVNTILDVSSNSLQAKIEEANSLKAELEAKLDDIDRNGLQMNLGSAENLNKDASLITPEELLRQYTEKLNDLFATEIKQLQEGGKEEISKMIPKYREASDKVDAAYQTTQRRDRFGVNEDTREYGYHTNTDENEVKSIGENYKHFVTYLEKKQEVFNLLENLQTDYFEKTGEQQDQSLNNNKKQLVEEQIIREQEQKIVEENVERLAQLQEERFEMEDKVAEHVDELRNREVEGIKAREAIQIQTIDKDKVLQQQKNDIQEESQSEQLESIESNNQEVEQAEADSHKTRAEQWKEYAEKVSAISQQISEVTGMVTSSLGGMFGQLAESYSQQVEELTNKISALDEEKEAALERVSLSEEERSAKEEELAQQKIDLEYATSEEQKNKADERIATLQGELGAEDSINRDFESKKASLEKEKAKKEKEQQKAEKMQKRLQMGQAIVEAVGNIAQGAAKALAMGPILGPILAAVVSAAGAIQVGIMTKQLAKMEDGGLLNGKRHSQGGMRILGSNIEVEGGEYVMNRQTTQKNLGLIEYINSQRKTLDTNDINSYFGQPFSMPTFSPSPFAEMMKGDQVVPMLSPTDSVDTKILNAIEKINFQPRVSVTDINTVHDNMVKVDEWTGL